MRRRLVHFYYAALTMREIPDHFEALRNENAMLRAKLFDRAGAPWEGDSVSLQYVLLQVCQNWPLHLDGAPSVRSIKCPIEFSDEEIREITNHYNQEQEKMTELEEMREVVGIDALGWVPDDEQLENSKTIAQKIKAFLSIPLLKRSASLSKSIFRSMIMKKMYDIQTNLMRPLATLMYSASLSLYVEYIVDDSHQYQY